MFQIAICENDTFELTQIKKAVDEWAKTLDTECEVATFNDGQSLLDSKNVYHLYLLDIMMPGMNGIEVAREIRKYDDEVPIAYVTSSTTYALDAFGVHAIRYLQKPVNSEELIDALTFAYHLYIQRPKHIVSVKSGKEVVSFALEDIVCIENDVRKMTYTLNDKRTFQTQRRSGSFEDSVYPVSINEDFVQPHKSYFVNMHHIERMRSEKFILDNGMEIPITRQRLTPVKQAYMKFIKKGIE